MEVVYSTFVLNINFGSECELNSSLTSLLHNSVTIRVFWK